MLKNITLSEDEAESILGYLEETQYLHEEIHGNSCRGCWENGVKQGGGESSIPKCKPDCNFKAIVKRLEDLLAKGKEAFCTCKEEQIVNDIGECDICGKFIMLST